MDPFLDLIKEFPWFADLAILMGTLRVIFKPVVILIDTIINQTPTKEDDQKWSEIKGSKLWATALFILDWFASVKIPEKKK